MWNEAVIHEAVTRKIKQAILKTAQRCRFFTLKIYEVPRNHFFLLLTILSSLSASISHTTVIPPHCQERLGEIMYHCNIKSPWGMFVVGSWHLDLWLSSMNQHCSFLHLLWHLDTTSVLHIRNETRYHTYKPRKTVKTIVSRRKVGYQKRLFLLQQGSTG